MPRLLSFYPWYPADYRADTRHLSRAQHFAYREILDEIFLSGQDSNPPSIPDDDEFLSVLCKADSPEEWTVTRRVLIDGPRALLRSEGGQISQRRLTVEIEKAADLSNERRRRASNAAKARWETGRQATNAPEPVPDHGENGGGAFPEAAGGNGNGHATMSDKQFLFYAGRVGKWLDEKRDLYHGSSSEPGSAFARDFEATIGISWQLWTREKLLH